MSERSLQIENSRLRREVTQLKKELDDLRRIGRQDQQSKITEPATATAPEPERKSFDPFNPCPNDPVFNMLRQQHQHRKRRWMDCR
jgi:hypothetical protein